MDTPNQENVVMSQNEPILPEFKSDNHPQSNFLVVLLSILLTLSVLISGFFAYQTQKLVKELTIIKSQEKAAVVGNVEPVATSSAVTTDPTANWKTYTNSKYQIAFDYPSTWKFTETKEPDVQTWYDANIFQLISPNVVSFDHGEINGGYYLTLSVSKPNSNYSNFQEFLNYSKDQYKYLFTSRKINNIGGYIITQNGKETGYIFSKNNLFFVINLLTDKDIQTLDQILSTFKFVGSNVPDSISNLFDSINKKFGLNLVPVEENQFYSTSGPITKKSWKLDLINSNLDKSFSIFLNSQLKLNGSESGGIGGGGVDVYESDDIKCAHSYMSQGPDIHNYLSCTEK